VNTRMEDLTMALVKVVPGRCWRESGDLTSLRRDETLCRRSTDQSVDFTTIWSDERWIGEDYRALAVSPRS
jgi:hypothetical protein